MPVKTKSAKKNHKPYTLTMLSAISTKILHCDSVQHWLQAQLQLLVVPGLEFPAGVAGNHGQSGRNFLLGAVCSDKGAMLLVCETDLALIWNLHKKMRVTHTVDEGQRAAHFTSTNPKGSRTFIPQQQRARI